MTKFSEELIGAQLALVCFAASLAIYWLVIRKKKKENTEWVSAALVRAYLDRVRSEEQEIRFKLFGEVSQIAASSHAPLASALGTVTTVTDPALLKEVDALRSQLSASDQRALEFDRMLNGLRAEKATLEEKLKAAPVAGASGAVASAGPSPEAMKELEELKARLQEYEVIEDDLANLKKFQKENEQLRQKMEQYEKGGAVATTISATLVAAEPVMVVSGGSEKAAPTMTLVSSAPVAAPEANADATQVVAPPAEAPTAEAPTAEKTAKQKEEELLSEFEKMLAS